MANNDNNLLLIILIASVLFCIFNINTTDYFTNNNSINYSKESDSNKSESNKSDSKINSFEHYENKRNSSNKISSSNDQQLIDNLYRDKMSVSSAPKSSESPKIYSDGRKRDDTQKILQSPPTMQRNTQINNISRDISKQLIVNDNMVTEFDKKQDNNSSLDQGYMLLPQNFIPDKKFEKVMPPESRNALTSDQLLPREENKDWFQVPNSKFNLMQAVDLEVPEIKIGIDTVGQSRKNATYDLRTAPSCPKFAVSPWSNSTIEPDYNTKSLC
jgi:hypothetical protein